MDQPDRQEIKPPKVMLVGDFRWGFTWGLIIVCIGVALLLDHMGVLPFTAVFQFWPLLLVLFGVMNITTQSGRALGFILIVAGILVQLDKLGLLHLTFGDIWPIAIIAIGVLMIWASIATRGVSRRKGKIDWTKAGVAESFRQQLIDSITSSSPLFNAFAVFGSCERQFGGQRFEGGKATAIFGGIELDFRDADLEDEAVLEISCVFGGVEIRVPETWYVHSRSLPVFGGFEDKTRQSRVEDPSGAKKKKLIISGIVVFGGVEIKN